MRSGTAAMRFALVVLAAGMVVWGLAETQTDRTAQADDRAFERILLGGDPPTTPLEELLLDMRDRLERIEALVTPSVGFSATVCFEIGGGAKVTPKAEAEAKGRARGTVGVDAYGNGAKAQADVEGKAQAEVGYEVKLGELKATFCLDIPIDFAGADADNALIDAMRMSGEDVQAQLADVAATLGWDPATLAQKVNAALAQIETFDIPTQPFMLLPDLRDRIPELIANAPMNAGLRNRVQDFVPEFPVSLEQLRPCDPDFLFDLPPEIQALLDEMCTGGADLESAFARIVDSADVVDAINTRTQDIRTRVVNVNGDTDHMRSIINRICDAVPGCDR